MRSRIACARGCSARSRSCSVWSGEAHSFAVQEERPNIAAAAEALVLDRGPLGVCSPADRLGPPRPTGPSR